ncbi:hypothetical protein PIB30_043356 [Stylosanthes scabra]|uniref:Uncharacterized protein n=1 Tax=Stylosanthes scabra TaxID=79078 RepID=A0ABU6WIZ8_9FABA|nr:hypothetical protein [Stylosanthes scabra]
MSLITVTTVSACSAGTSTPFNHDRHRRRALLRHGLPCFRHKSPEIALFPSETAAAAVVDLPAVAAVACGRRSSLLSIELVIVAVVALTRAAIVMHLTLHVPGHTWESFLLFRVAANIACSYSSRCSA